MSVQSGTLQLNGNLTNNKLVSLGAGDALSVTGNYAQGENGTLKTAIASASSFGSLSVAGASTLAGLLAIAPTGGFHGELGQSFAILSSSGQSGAFSFVAGAAIGGDLSYQPNYSATGVALTVVSSEGREAPPRATAGPTISGTPEQGQTLVLTHGSWEHAPGEYIDQWLRCESAGGGCVPIVGATGQTYVVSAADTGHTIAVQEIARNAGGEGSPVSAGATAAVAALPLRAVVGERVRAVEGQRVTLDGSGSTPASEISSYQWSFGDGEGASGAVVSHAYSSPGTYTATLTVTRGSEQQSHAVTVNVESRPAPAKAAAITLRGANDDAIADVEILYIAPDGTRTEASTNGEGVADLASLPPGADTVYAYKSGFRPATGLVVVDGEHVGSTEITMEPGEVASTGLSSQELTLSEIVSAGIDPSEPANQTVYHFEAALEFVGSVTVELHGYINSEGQFAGGASPTGSVGSEQVAPTPFKCQEHSEEPERTSCEGTFHEANGAETHVIAVPATIETHPVIQWLILRTTAATVKQFFEVSMVVQNLSSEEPFTLSPGTATLNLPAGLSLAPTSSAQALSQVVANIPPLGSASINWIVRGDAPGRYIPSASYEAKLEPFETPVTLQSALVTPLEVWGANALSPVLRADRGPAERGIPYHATLGVKNTSNIPLYNVAIGGSASAQRFIFQPHQQFETTIGELQPGQTVFPPEDIVIAQSPGEIFEEGPHEGRIIEERAAELAHVSLAGETAAAPGTVQRLAPPRLYGLSESASGHLIHLHWEQVPGAEGYEIFSTPSLATPFNEEALSVAQGEGEPVQVLPASASSADVNGPAFFAVSALLNGRLVLDHPVVESAKAEQEAREREEQEEEERNHDKEHKEREEEEKKEKKEKETQQEKEPSEAEPYSPYCVNGDAVNCLTGNHTETQTDLSVGGRGPGLHLARTYSSQAGARASAPGPFGYGWTGPYSAYLTVWRLCETHNASCAETSQGGGYAVLHEANGAQVYFFHERSGSHGWSARSTVLASLSEERGSYVLHMPDGHVLSFNASGRLSSGPSGSGFFTVTEGTLPLSSETDRNGNSVALAYEGSRLTKVTDGAGRSISLSYNGEGQVTSASDPLGHTVKYGYEHGNLVSVTEPSETSPRWRFGYDAAHEMTSESEGGGPAAVTEYDAQHRAITQTDAMGRKRSWSYFVSKSLRQTTITEPNGSFTVEKFNEGGSPTSVTRAFDTSSAATTNSEYNGEGQLTATIDADGHKTTYGYDAAGDRTSETDALGNTTRHTFNEAHEPTSETSPNGEKTTFERDAHGNTVEVSRPAPGGHTQLTKYTYDTSGDVMSMTDALGHTWTYTYDQYGDRASETDPEGNKRTFSYDLDSNVIATVSPRGNVAGAEASKFTTKTERDGQERIAKTVNALGRTTTTTHNPTGTVASVTDALGHKTTYAYDTDNELVKVTEADGAKKETEYDAAGQVIATIDGNGHKTTYVRNPLEKVTQITDPLGRKTRKSYDGAGQPRKRHRRTRAHHNLRIRRRQPPHAGELLRRHHPHGEIRIRRAGSAHEDDRRQRHHHLRLRPARPPLRNHRRARRTDRLRIRPRQPPGRTRVSQRPLRDAYLRRRRAPGERRRLARTHDQLHLRRQLQPHRHRVPRRQRRAGHEHLQRRRPAHRGLDEERHENPRLARLHQGQRRRSHQNDRQKPSGRRKTAYTYDASQRLVKAGTTSYAYDPAGNLTQSGTSTNTFDSGTS